MWCIKYMRWKGLITGAHKALALLTLCHITLSYVRFCNVMPLFFFFFCGNTVWSQRDLMRTKNVSRSAEASLPSSICQTLFYRLIVTRLTAGAPKPSCHIMPVCLPVCLPGSQCCSAIQLAVCCWRMNAAFQMGLKSIITDIHRATYWWWCCAGGGRLIRILSY